jgi:hypothetical protein
MLRRCACLAHFPLISPFGLAVAVSKGKVVGERNRDLRLEGNALRLVATQEQPAQT